MDTPNTFSLLLLGHVERQKILRQAEYYSAHKKQGHLKLNHEIPNFQLTLEGLGACNWEKLVLMRTPWSLRDLKEAKGSMESSREHLKLKGTRGITGNSRGLREVESIRSLSLWRFCSVGLVRSSSFLMMRGRVEADDDLGGQEVCETSTSEYRQYTINQTEICMFTCSLLSKLTVWESETN